MNSLSEKAQGLQPARICIIKPSSLGDVIHALPILGALRARWPLAQITWVVRRPFHEVLEGHPHLDELLVYDRGRRNRVDLRAGARMAGLLRALSRGRFDLAVDLQGLFRSGLMTAATRAQVRVGFADAREGAHWFYTDSVVAPRLEIHAVERMLRVATALGGEVTEPRFDVPIGEGDRLWAQAILSKVRSPRIILNVGARWPTKRWPPEHFAEVARRAVAEFGAGLIAVGSADDRPRVDELAGHLGSVPLLDLCGQTRLLELAALNVESDLLISNDTGPLHLAAAVGARVVGIFTCSNPRLTGPYGPRAVTVQTRVECAGSRRRRCDRLDCFVELTPARVWPVISQQLQQVLAVPSHLNVVSCRHSS